MSSESAFSVDETPPSPGDRIMSTEESGTLYGYYKHVVENWNELDESDLPPWPAIEEEDKARIYESIEYVKFIINNFLPTYTQNYIPKRLINLRTMQLTSCFDQDLFSSLIDKLYEMSKRDIQSNRDIETRDYIAELVEKSCYGILSHRWGINEVTFSDIQIFSKFTRKGVENLIELWQGDQEKFEKESMLSVLAKSSKGLKETEESTIDISLLSLLFKLVNSVELSERSVNYGFKKLINFCYITFTEHQYEWAWMDTCCIDKGSSAELDEAIRSMFRWYRNSGICIIHLSSTPKAKTDYMMLDPWFKRGWTLQELLAPKAVKFYDRNWIPFTDRNQRNDKVIASGNVSEPIEDEVSDDSDSEHSQEAPSFSPGEDEDRESLIWRISRITEISMVDLLHFKPGLKNLRTGMRWASNRETTRVEDQAYSLLGIFNVSIPIAYGEGDIAFYRLQTAIMQESSDRSIFLWGGDGSEKSTMLAGSPLSFADEFDVIAEDFQHIEDGQTQEPSTIYSHFTLTNHGLQIALSIYDKEVTARWMADLEIGATDTKKYRLAVLAYSRQDGQLEPIFILLTQHKKRGQTYYKRSPLWRPQTFPDAEVPRALHPELIYIQ